MLTISFSFLFSRLHISAAAAVHRVQGLCHPSRRHRWRGPQLLLRRGCTLMSWKRLLFSSFHSVLRTLKTTFSPNLNLYLFLKNHRWMLSEEVNILPYLLLPLAGPEELSDEDMDGKWEVWVWLSGCVSGCVCVKKGVEVVSDEGWNGGES